MGDWIQMEKIKMLSLRCTIILYMAVALIVSTILSLYLVSSAADIQENIWFKYIDKEAYGEGVKKESGNNYLAVIPRIRSKNMEEQDVLIVEVCDFIQTWGALFLSFGGCTIAILLFYRNKLKVPLRELSKASKRISENDMNFEIVYNNTDEMGTLCKDFERMRKELSNHKKKMWNMVEDEKTLRSAIAHDIRTPITIAKGNLEMIEEFLPQRKITEDKALEMVGKTVHHIEHLERFVDTMKHLNKMADMEPSYKKTAYAELVNKVRDIQQILCQDQKIDFAFYSNDMACEIEVDTMFIIQVEENLLANALRYAKSKIEVSLELGQDYIKMIVADDGPGFREAPQKLLQAYFKSKEEQGDIHYGLGLYISKTLCDSHLGELVLENKRKGGAMAIAKFGFEKPVVEGRAVKF